MKSLVSLACLLLSTTVLASVQVITVPTTDIFVPFGFDANDNAEVIVTGYLPNWCYKVPQQEVIINGNNININIKAFYTATLNSACLEMVVPFTEVINLGVLDKGTYTVNVNPEQKRLDNKKLTAKLKISESSSDAIDDHIYAKVENILVEDGEIILKGYNPSDCIELQGVKVINNGIDTYSVLPQMKKVSDFCPMKPSPFEYKTKLPTTLQQDYVLLHVRVMDGKSVNRVISTKYDY